MATIEEVTVDLAILPRETFELNLEAKYHPLFKCIDLFLRKINQRRFMIFFKKRWENCLRSYVRRHRYCTKQRCHKSGFQCVYHKYFHQNEVRHQSSQWMIKVKYFFDIVQLFLKRSNKVRYRDNESFKSKETKETKNIIPVSDFQKNMSRSLLDVFVMNETSSIFDSFKQIRPIELKN